MPIIDAHVHVGDKYQPMAPFEDTGRVDRLLYLMDECGVEKAIMVPVVAEFSPNNNAECARWAREHPERLANMVDVAMHEPDAAIAIARAREEFGAIAISYYPNSADISWMLDPQHQTLWEALAASDLPCNLHVTPPNYPVLLELARGHSDVRFVCNHLGLPSTTLDPSDTTYGGLAEAHNLPNIYIKASAFYGASSTPWDFRAPRALSFFTTLVCCLGPQRLLWGTDWPPASRHLSYRQALEIVRTCAEGLTQDELDLILGGNAAQVFNL